MVLFFSNCNIDTREEFERRLDAARRLGEADGVEVVADEYDHADWLEKVAAGFENEPEKGRMGRCAWLRRIHDFTHGVAPQGVADGLCRRRGCRMVGGREGLRRQRRSNARVSEDRLQETRRVSSFAEEVRRARPLPSELLWLRVLAPCRPTWEKLWLAF